MGKRLLWGRTVIGLLAAFVVCAAAAPAVAQRNTGAQIKEMSDQYDKESEALKKAVEEAKSKKPSDQTVKDAEDKLDAAEQKLLETPEDSPAAKQAQKNVDAARKAADKAQSNAGEDAGEYRSGLRKIRGIRHRLAFLLKRAQQLERRLGRVSGDETVLKPLTDLEKNIQKELDNTKAGSIAAAFGPGFGPDTMLAGWTMYAGANVAIGFGRNDYDGVLFDGAGPGIGGQIGARYNFPSGLFVGAEVGGTALAVAGNHHEGPFTDINWQLWQIVQIGTTTQAFGRPVAVHIGGGVTEARFTAGFDNGFFRDAMSDTVTGWLVRGGAEFGVWQNASVGALYQFSRFDGHVQHEPIKAEIHTVLITFNYQIPIGR